MATEEKLLVAAIDFGTTYSGLAFSFKHHIQMAPTNVFVITWTGNQLPSLKAPTCVLIKPDGKTVDKFGFEAEARYSELSETGDHKQWYYFPRFKMLLREKPIHKDTMLEDECVKGLPALTVFSLSIRYMKEHVLQQIMLPGCEIYPEDIHWVLTVPAIWNESAQHFMRLAAKEAGIPTKNLTIALEPVAALMYCRHATAQLDRDLAFQTGKKYLVLNEGGGTRSITVHEVCLGGKLKELYKDEREAPGEIMVENAYLDFIAELTGKDVLSCFKRQHKADYADLLRDFEIKKRSADLKTDGPVRIALPATLLKLVNDIKGQSMAHDIQNSRHAKKTELHTGRLRIDVSIFRSFFKQSIDGTLTHLSTVLRKPETSGVETILMVGDYSASLLLQEAIRKEFPRMNVIVPSDAGLAVLKGAVIFGHCPLELTVLKDALNALTSDESTNSEDLGKSNARCDNQMPSEPHRPSWSVMPSYWAPMKADEIVKQIPLPVTGEEFSTVLTSFAQTLDNRDIISIQRIQSKFLWEHYCVKRKEMEKINGQDGAREMNLFHGTKPDIIGTICAENLDMRLAGTNAGAILGDGTYFASSAKISDNYATPDPNSGHKFMLQCRVLVGRWAKGQQGLRRPPEIPVSTPGGQRSRYNSCVDDVLKPRIFCIFDHVQYYPEYVIEYE